LLIRDSVRKSRSRGCTAEDSDLDLQVLVSRAAKYLEASTLDGYVDAHAKPTYSQV